MASTTTQPDVPFIADQAVLTGRWPSRPAAEPGRFRRPRPVWTNRARSTWVSVDEVNGVCVVCVEGALDGAALEPCRAALDAALHDHPRCVVVDLGHTDTPHRDTIALLGAAKRYLDRRGASMTLAGTSDQLMDALTIAGVSGLYDYREPLADDSALPSRRAGRVRATSRTVS